MPSELQFRVGTYRRVTAAARWFAPDLLRLPRLACALAGLTMLAPRGKSVTATPKTSTRNFSVWTRPSRTPGFMVGYYIGFELNAAGVSWRVILGSSTILAAVLLVARFGLPEPPRWLWNVGRRDEARAVAHKYLHDVADMDDVEHEDGVKGTFSMLFNAHHWRATLFMSVFWFCAVAPYFAIATFADSVLQQYGLAGGLAGGVGVSAVALAGVVLTVALHTEAPRPTSSPLPAFRVIQVG
jgi:hypothetical protein